MWIATRCLTKSFIITTRTKYRYDHIDKKYSEVDTFIWKDLELGHSKCDGIWSEQKEKYRQEVQRVENTKVSVGVAAWGSLPGKDELWVGVSHCLIRALSQLSPKGTKTQRVIPPSSELTDTSLEFADVLLILFIETPGNNNPLVFSVSYQSQKFKGSQ